MIDVQSAPTIKINKKLNCLFEPHRYKVVHSGRGAGKSWGFARALLCLGAQQPERILCAREIQNSIKDSVHKLLCDQIELLELTDFYDVMETEIRGANGTQFLFTGLAKHTVESLKSYEGMTRCWVEEAQAVSKRSWDILIPTIRTEGSEIWISLNPELDTDETYVRFVQSPPPDAVVIYMTYQDNLWFPKTLEQERAYCQMTRPDDYENIWEGKPRTTVDGAIYAREVLAATTERRICHLPYDPYLKVHTVWDLGWNDQMTVILIQRGVTEVRVFDYLEVQFKRVDEVVSLLMAHPLNWGYDWLPQDGYSHDCKSGVTVEQIIKSFGRRPKPVPRTDVEAGIRAARVLFPRCYFDQAKTGRLLECLKRYRRHVPNHGEPASPMHDEFSHGADAFRYLALSVDQMTNEFLYDRKLSVPTFQADPVTGVFG